MESKPQAGKKEETVQRIIKGATQVFADLGFDGASVDEIAQRAGVNKATIYYHIGDKDALYAAVLHDVIGHTIDRISQSLEDNQGPEEKLLAYIQGIADTVSEYPPLPPVMMRAVASRGQNLPASVAQDLVMVYGMLMEILDEGAKNGVFIKANGLIIYLMILGTIALHKNIETTWSESVGFPEMFRSLSEDLYAHVDGSIATDLAREVGRLVLKSLKK